MQWPLQLYGQMPSLPKAQPPQIIASPEAQARYGNQLLKDLPKLAQLPSDGMPIVILTSQDLQKNFKGPWPSLTSLQDGPEWTAMRKAFYDMLGKMLPAENAAALANPEHKSQIDKTLTEPLTNMYDPHESSTVIELGSNVCVMVMGDASETPGQLASSFAAVSDNRLPGLQALTTDMQYKWLLVHEARHCGQHHKNIIGYEFRTGDEADADEVANKAFPGIAGLVLRERAMVGLHLILPAQTRPELELRSLNVHATALPLMSKPGHPYTLSSNEIAQAYRLLAENITREMLRSGKIEPEADLWVEVIDDILAGKTDVHLKDADRDSFRAGRERLSKEGSRGFRELITPADQQPGAFKSFLIWQVTGADNALAIPQNNAPILSAYLSANPNIPPLARLAGLLYLRAAADLDPALEQYALPLPPGIAFPPMPDAIAPLPKDQPVGEQVVRWLSPRHCLENRHFALILWRFRFG